MKISGLSIIWAIAGTIATTSASAQQTAAPTPTPAPKAAAPAAAKPPAVPSPAVARYKMAAGDLNGDGVAESIVYDTVTKAIRVIDYNIDSPFQTMAIYVKDTVTSMTTADLDGDGKEELITGEGLVGYNPKEGPQTDASVKIYRPDTKGDWKPVEIYRKASERPDVTSLEVRDVDGDGQKDILFAYFASKYMTNLRVAKKSGKNWTVTELPTVRMGTSVDVGDVLGNGRRMVVVGRPYGDPADPKSTTAIGGAFVMDGDRRIELPVMRGVSSVAVGDLDGKKGDEIVVGDGWHANYGKLARSRIAVVSRQGNEWKYDLIEDLDNHLRFEKIDLVDLTGDAKPEIVGWASQTSTLGGSVRVYERTANGWRGMTAGELAQTFAIGDFNGDRKRELVFAGQPPMPFSLSSQAPQWSAELGEAVETRDVNPKSLLNKTAPALQATEWLGSDPQTLANLKGKVVLLDFWATWCKPCIEMYPEMRQWVKEFGPQGLVILGITNHSRQKSPVIARFFERHKLPWPVAIDPKNRTHIDYGVSPIPHTFLIDRDGVVRMQHRGGGDLTAIKNKIRELLAQKGKEAE